jgi:hypothetical protein
MIGINHKSSTPGINDIDVNINDELPEDESTQMEFIAYTQFRDKQYIMFSDDGANESTFYAADIPQLIEALQLIHAHHLATLEK